MATPEALPAGAPPIAVHLRIWRFRRSPGLLAATLLLVTSVAWAGHVAAEPTSLADALRLAAPHLPFIALSMAGAVGAWRVATTRSRGREVGALALFAGQMVLAGLWPPALFFLHHPLWGLGLLLVLLAAAAATLAAFLRVDRLAAVLFAPYVGWIACATALAGAPAVLP